MAYVLDANVFIAAKNLHYGLDFCPAFWDWLIARGLTGDVFSIDKVENEVAALGETCRGGRRTKGRRSSSRSTQRSSRRWES